MSLEDQLRNLEQSLDSLERSPRQIIRDEAGFDTNLINGYGVLAGAAALLEYQSGLLATRQSTTSTSYTNLSTVGPQVSVKLGQSGTALVYLSAQSEIVSIGGSPPFNYGAGCGFSIDGTAPNGTPYTLAAADSRAFFLSASFYIGGIDFKASAGRMVVVQTGVPNLSATFTLKYKSVSANAVYFSDRRIIVLPI